MRVIFQTVPALVISFAMCPFLQHAVAKEATTDLNAARQTGWQVAFLVVEKIQASDPKDFPGIQAWLKDFCKQTKGLDLKTTPEKWPMVDVDALGHP